MCHGKGLQSTDLIGGHVDEDFVFTASGGLYLIGCVVEAHRYLILKNLSKFNMR
jgi:hypothetical protein